jgi:hypothetical protein
LTKLPGELNVSPYHGEDDELVTAMAPRLRKLHTEGRRDAASFPRIVQLLRAHAEPKNNSHSKWSSKVTRGEDVWGGTPWFQALIYSVAQERGLKARTQADGKQVVFRFYSSKG